MKRIVYPIALQSHPEDFYNKELTGSTAALNF